MEGKRIAVIEDDPLLRESLGLFLRVNGYQVESFGNAEEAFAAGDFRRFSAVISDFLLPGADGISVLRRARDDSKGAITILITAYRGKELPDEAERAGVDAILPKPFSTAQLQDTLHRLAGRGGSLAPAL